MAVGIQHHVDESPNQVDVDGEQIAAQFGDADLVAQEMTEARLEAVRALIRKSQEDGTSLLEAARSDPETAKILETIPEHHFNAILTLV